MRKIKLGLLGAGICANTFHLPALQRLSDRFELVALAGANPEQNAAYASRASIGTIYTDYRDLIANPDVEAIISCYPYYLNEELITAAVAAGKHILVEKPIAEGIPKAVRTASLDKGRLVIGVAENWLYWQTVPMILEEIASGAIGEVLMAQQYSYYNIDLEDQYMRGKAWRRTARGGMILDRSIHAIALMRALFGSVKRATGLTTGVRDELGEMDTMTTLLEYESGIKGSIITCASAPGVKVPFGLAVIGKRGTITVADFMTRITISNAEGCRERIADNGDGGYYLEFLDFYNAIVNGTRFKSDLAGASNDLFAAMAAFETPGQWVTPQDFGAV